MVMNKLKYHWLCLTIKLLLLKCVVKALLIYRSSSSLVLHIRLVANCSCVGVDYMQCIFLYIYINININIKPVSVNTGQSVFFFSPQCIYYQFQSQRQHWNVQSVEPSTFSCLFGNGQSADDIQWMSQFNVNWRSWC